MRSTLIAIIALAVATPLYAFPIIDVEQTPIEVDGLMMNPDGEWLEGRDWGFTPSSTWLDETWQGSLGVEAWFLIDVVVEPGRVPTNVDVVKDVVNNTTFDWTGFEISVTPLPGSTITNVQAMPSGTDFPTVAVIDNAGSWLIEWSQDGGGDGVPIGDTGTFSFSFDIDGPISFDLVQIPIPEPASLALLAVGGLLCLRRRAA